MRFRAVNRIKLTRGTLGQAIIRKGRMVDGPLWQQPTLYADYAGSGRALREIGDFVREYVLPAYANPHTQASYCGRSINALRRAARAEVARICRARMDAAVIFAGSGATAGIQKLVRLFGADQQDDAEQRALVLLGPCEQHANLPPCRERGCPMTIRVDNGGASAAVQSTIYLSGHGSVGLPARCDPGVGFAALRVSRPGKPTNNAFIEAFNSKLRGECPNAHWFLSLEDACEKLEAWQ